MFQHSRLIGTLTACAVVACLLLIPSAASAQTSTISVTVTDQSGGVLPGVTGEARSPDMIEEVRTAISDGSGLLQIIALEPGTYSVTLSLPGFSTVVREGIELSTGFTASFDIIMAVGDIAETITVSGASPIVDIVNVEQRQVMDRDVIDSIPTGKSFQAYANLIPGMSSLDGFLSSMSQDQGGMTGNTLARLAIHGGDQEDQQLEINGLDVGDSLTQGANYSVFPDSNFEEIAYNYSSSPAEIESGGVRINMIPREGANQFSGHFFTTFTFPELNANNVDQDLIDQGLETGMFVDEIWTINPVVGGPIVQDKLWFFAAHTSQVANTLPANTFFAEDVRAPFYVPGDIPALDAATIHEQSLNLTYQATSKDKIKAYWTNSSTDQPHLLQGRALASIFVAPEASIDAKIRTNTYQATWTRPQTNRLLFEAGFSHLPVQYVLRTTAEAEAALDLPGTIQVPGTIATRNQSAWFSGATNRNSPKHTNQLRGSVSYVTGSHNLKFGMTALWLGENALNFSENDWQSQIVIQGLGPIDSRFYTPAWEVNRARNTGFYAQDQWTLDRLTINAGLRYDYEASRYPSQTLPAAIWAPQEVSIEGLTTNGWHDLQPRIGAAYDLTGDGKTALKFGAFRFGKRNATDIAKLINPSLNNRRSIRTFFDGGDPFGSGAPACIGAVPCVAGDGLVQGDPLNQAPNGELLSVESNPSFGVPTINTFANQDWAFGWGQRPSNWEISASIQQEVVSGVSVDFGYFRRSWVSFFVENNEALGPEDFDSAQLAIPQDPRLPDGGGGTVTYFDVKPESVRAPLTVFDSADNFGGESRNWQGIDLTVDARLDNLLVSGGLSTGALSEDNCEVSTQLPETLRQNRPRQGGTSAIIPIDYCDTSQNWLTQVKFLGSYTLPYDVQVAATLQNQPGVRRVAEVAYSGADLAAALGRPATSASATIDVIEPGSTYGSRFSQFDLRLTKIFSFNNGTRLRAMFDLFNLFNSNAITRESTGYGSPSGGGAGWAAPQVIMAGRLAKFAFQFDF